MIAAPEMRSPAPRANADRAIYFRNAQFFTAIPAEPQTDLARPYISRRYGLTMPLARLVAGLARLGGVLA